MPASHVIVPMGAHVHDRAVPFEYVLGAIPMVDVPVDQTAGERVVASFVHYPLQGGEGLTNP